MMEPANYRPLVTLKDGVIYMDDKKARVILRRDRIFVGCHDITPEAMKFIHNKWHDQFVDGDPRVLQEGE